jgi:predicted amidophosphoribosyltransferase
VVLVPVPRSSPIREGDLWPSYEIAKAMQDLRLGRVSTLLERIERVNPSSRSGSEDRPSPLLHFQTIRLQGNLPANVKCVILVDDIVTRGHTFMGCAWKIEEAYPDVSIHAFAAVRAVSNPDEFKAFYDPVVESGTITYRPDTGDCLRRP